MVLWFQSPCTNKNFKAILIHPIHADFSCGDKHTSIVTSALVASNICTAKFIDDLKMYS